MLNVAPIARPSVRGDAAWLSGFAATIREVELARLDTIVLYLHHPSSLEHDPRSWSPEHPDTPERIEVLEQAMEAAGWPGCERRQAPAASEDDLLAVHSRHVVDRIRDLSEEGGGQIDSDTFVVPESYEAALYAAGAACEMVRALLGGQAGTGFCGTRPAGHHAEQTRSMGFCLFNNVAVAAELAIRELGIERVLIIDWDVHHGNGTAEIFRRRSDVMFASIHQRDLYPGTGSIVDAGSGPGLGYTINVPVPSGSREDVWLSVLEYVIIPPALAFRPQLVLISAGFDAHEDDPMADCVLDSEAFAMMARHVRDLGRQVGAPIGAVLEGGYAPEALAESVLATIRALDGEGEADSIAPDQIVTTRASSYVGQYWEL